MKRKSALAKAFKGHWRIVEMDNWPDQDDLDLAETAHITFEGDTDGEIVFGALKGWLDVRYGSRTEPPAPNSPGKDTTKPPRSAAGAGSPSAPPGASSATSSSTTATNPASYASQTEFFNSLLGPMPVSGHLYRDALYDTGLLDGPSLLRATFSWMKCGAGSISRESAERLPDIASKKVSR